MINSQLLINIEAKLFSLLESISRRNAKANRSLQTIWIVGAPRSGTTLAYQLLCSVYRSYYISNNIGNRYRTALFTRLIERFNVNELIPSGFNSEYGNTPQSTDPHEGGAFFYQYFLKNNEHFKENLLNNNGEAIVKHIGALAQPNSLFISKNTVHSFRIVTLSKLFEHSAFVWVHRPIEEIVYSILKARRKLNIADNDWWGVRPPNWENMITLPVIDKTIWQVQETQNCIKEGFLLSKAKYVKVHYNQLCDNPKELINRISVVLELLEFERDSLEHIPPSFSKSLPPQDDLFISIKRKLELV